MLEIARHLGVSISAVSQIFRRREKSALTLSTPSPKLRSILGLGIKKNKGLQDFWKSCNPLFEPSGSRVLSNRFYRQACRAGLQDRAKSPLIGLMVQHLSHISG